MPRAFLFSLSLLVAVAARTQTGTLTRLPSAGEPNVYGAPAAPSIALDVARNRVVLIQGDLLGASVNTFEYDGAQWTLQATAPAAPSATASTVIYDEVRQRCVVASTTGFHLDLSEWMQGAWRTFATTPLLQPVPVGGRVALARDPLQNRSVTTAGGGTYMFDGVQLTAAGAAPSLVLAAFDPRRGEVLGHDFYTTFSFDGVAWRDLQATPFPSTQQMVSDPVLGRILAVTVSGITEWNGFRWRQAYTLGGSLPAPSTKTIAVDPRTGDALVMVLANNGVAGSTWHYRELPAVPGTFGPHGAGCAGPLGVPSWVPPGDPPRLGRLLLCVLRNVPDGPQNITIVSAGTNAASWARQPLPLSLAPFGAPGCQVFVEPLVTVPRQAWLRLVAWEMPMPAGPAAIGARFYLQAATLVPGWNGLSTITSDAATGVIGTR